jgi:hypothetical protein
MRQKTKIISLIALSMIVAGSLAMIAHYDPEEEEEMDIILGGTGIKDSIWIDHNGQGLISAEKILDGIGSDHVSLFDPSQACL